MFSIYLVNSIILTVFGRTLEQHSLHNFELLLFPVQHGAPQNLLLMLRVADALAPELEGALSFVDVAPHEVVTKLFVGLIPH